ncbi:VOC family protein [Fodinibius salsisoli]|uniref:VOC family protein n=1 Tax=Fodinibius salsisoli TaxID=2820877 RepID=A0ABT3PHX8_9BACT|nr:VOC family protein [Fodinibius salsisoli]MCW9705526.1 VOC family protein [Fodinibius salsisoli]
MIIKSSQVSIPVKDLDEAKEFYTGKLGFVVRTEMEFSPGWRYLTVAPSEKSETVLELQKVNDPERQKRIGKSPVMALVMFETDDIEKDYQVMKKRGVSFMNAPREVPGGKGAAFVDLYGNKLDLYQPMDH